MTHLLIHWTIFSLFSLSFLEPEFGWSVTVVGPGGCGRRHKVRNFRLIFIWLYVNETFAESPSGDLHTSGHLSRLWKQNNDLHHPRLYNLQQKKGEKYQVYRPLITLKSWIKFSISQISSHNQVLFLSAGLRLQTRGQDRCPHKGPDSLEPAGGLLPQV